MSLESCCWVKCWQSLGERQSVARPLSRADDGWKRRQRCLAAGPPLGGGRRWPGIFESCGPRPPPTHPPYSALHPLSAPWTGSQQMAGNRGGKKRKAEKQKERKRERELSAPPTLLLLLLLSLPPSLPPSFSLLFFLLLLLLLFFHAFRPAQHWPLTDLGGGTLLLVGLGSVKITPGYFNCSLQPSVFRWASFYIRYSPPLSKIPCFVICLALLGFLPRYCKQTNLVK